jgi:hypothetical protein
MVSTGTEKERQIGRSNQITKDANLQLKDLCSCMQQIGRPIVALFQGNWPFQIYSRNIIFIHSFYYK